MNRVVEVFPSEAELASAAADILADCAAEAVRSRGRCFLALSGGRTPDSLYRLLDRPEIAETIPWGDLEIFWSDERYVPLDHAASNAGQALALFLSRAPIAEDRIHPVYSETRSAEEAAAWYEERIRSAIVTPEPAFDLVFLGCGEDGHTASLFPGSPVLKEKRKLAAALHRRGEDHDRVTMTLPLLNHARRVVFLVTGASKAPVVERILRGEPAADLPASLVAPAAGTVHWLLDAEAARTGSAG